MLSVIVIDCTDVYVPPLGVKIGVGTAIVYEADVTALLLYPGAVAIALNPFVEETVIGPLYRLEEVVGVVPSVV